MFTSSGAASKGKINFLALAALKDTQKGQAPPRYDFGEGNAGHPLLGRRLRDVELELVGALSKWFGDAAS